MGRLITKTASGAVASFNGNKALPLESCKVNFLPVQSGTGDPSPSNVRPITGWNGVNVYHSGSDTSNPETYPITFPAMGKNLFNPTEHYFKNDYIRNENGEEISSQYCGYTPNPIAVLPNTQYTISGITETSSAIYRIYYLTSNGEWISRSDSYGKQNLPYTFTTPATCGAIQLQCGITCNYDTCQLELGSTATTYEPFDNTVYGGYVDVSSGKVYATWVGEEHKWEEFTSKDTISNCIRGHIKYKFIDKLNTNSYFNNHKSEAKFNYGKWSWSFSEDTPHFYVDQGTNQKYIYAFMPVGTDDNTMLQFSLTLATP